MTNETTRRDFLLASSALSLRAEEAVPIPSDLRTPYKLNRLLIPASGIPGAWDEKKADCPFVFHHQDKFYMTIVGSDESGYQTGLSSSSNLLDWQSEGLILKRNPDNPIIRYNAALTWIVRENSVFSEGKLKRIRGRYLGVYLSFPKPGREVGPGVIGLCWSRDLRNWEVEPPCLRPEDGSDWERGGLYKACLVEDKGTFYIFYNAKTVEQRWHEQTGVAYSTDLKRWTRFAGNPVIPNGGPGSLDEKFASDPCVVQYGKQWAIFYFSLDTKGFARERVALSPDLRHATKCDGVVIDVGPEGSIDERYAHKGSVIYRDHVLYHFYEAATNKNVRGITVAASRPLQG